MDPQKKRKYGAYGLGGMAGALGLISGSASKHAQTLKGIASQSKNLALTKAVKRLSGLGAVTSGVGAAYLANKYYKNRNKTG